jgi:hypothetical protein
MSEYPEHPRVLELLQTLFFCPQPPFLLFSLSPRASKTMSTSSNPTTTTPNLAARQREAWSPGNLPNARSFLKRGRRGANVNSRLRRTKAGKLVVCITRRITMSDLCTAVLQSSSSPWRLPSMMRVTRPTLNASVNEIQKLTSGVVQSVPLCSIFFVFVVFVLVILLAAVFPPCPCVF